ncbi:hypothetical protein BVX97_04670 [bacterium E08(2017)]|nr:hypothetical protein BVX97_04670 [bacterium E08(2017)]
MFWRCIMGKKIEVLARGVCIVNGKMLLCHTKGDENTYLPGGHVEFKESAREAICREISEEMDVSSNAGKYLGSVEHSFKQKGKRHCEINIVFQVDIPEIDSELDPESMEDYIEFVWADIKELAKHRLEPSALIELIPQWLDNPADNWGSSY